MIIFCVYQGCGGFDEFYLFIEEQDVLGEDLFIYVLKIVEVDEILFIVRFQVSFIFFLSEIVFFIGQLYFLCYFCIVFIIFSWKFY